MHADSRSSCSHVTVQLHNALLLSILYNTTRPTLPPSSVRHTGWHKRKRDKLGNKLEDSDPKRRQIKAKVMALGKKERGDIKALALVTGSVADVKGNARVDPIGMKQGRQEALRASLDSRGGRMGKLGVPAALEVDESLAEG
jgi:hypothetical protein